MKPTNSSATSLWSDCTSTRWWRLQSLTPPWRHAAVIKLSVSARFRPTAPEVETVWNEAARRQMIQQLWRLTGSRITFFVSIHHSVTSLFGALQREVEWACWKTDPLVVVIHFFLSTMRLGGFHLTLYNDNLSKLHVDPLLLFFIF